MRHGQYESSGTGWVLGQGPMEMPPPPSGPRAVLKRILGFMRAAIPSRASVVLFVVWLGLAAFNVHLIGAYLLRWMSETEQVFWIGAALTLGIPLLIAPRWSRLPLWWGTTLNIVALLLFAVLARQTSIALSEHGDWDVRWLEAHGHQGTPLQLARGVMSLSAWGIGMVPLGDVEALFRPISEAEREAARRDVVSSRDQLTHIGARSTGDAENSTWGDTREGASGSSGMDTGMGSGTGSNGTDSSGGLVLEAQAGRPGEGDQALQRSSNFEERRVAQLINEERMRRGLITLPFDESLARVARRHSEAMRSLGFYGHADPRGRGPQERVTEQTGSEAAVFESLARTQNAQDVPREIVTSLIRDVEERQLMVSEERGYHRLGVGLSCDGPDCLATVLYQQ